MAPTHRTALFALAICLSASAPAEQQADTAQQQSAPPVAAPAATADPALALPPSETIGDVLMARGRYLAAIHVYEKLPPTAVILNKTGMACEHMLMYDRARLSFEAALKLHQSTPKRTTTWARWRTARATPGARKRCTRWP